MLQSKYQLTVK